MKSSGTKTVFNKDVDNTYKKRLLYDGVTISFEGKSNYNTATVETTDYFCVELERFEPQDHVTSRSTLHAAAGCAQY